MKLFITTLLLGLLFIAPSKLLAAETEDILDKLTYLHQQILATDTNMQQFTMGINSDKALLAASKQAALSELKKIQSQIEKIVSTKELSELSNLNLKVIQSLTNIYALTEENNLGKIAQALDEHNKIYTNYSKVYQDAVKKYKPIITFPDGFDPLIEVMKLAHNKDDAENFQKAVDLLQKKQYKSAFDLLETLKKSYQKEPFEKCVSLKISDTLLAFDSDVKQDKDAGSKEGIMMLSKITDSKKYLPVLFEAFYKWRTATQYFEYNLENINDIPNLQYNEKRWELVNIIKDYLSKNPNDIWGQVQLNLLLTLPNINYSAQFGNDNLMHWTRIYTDLPRQE
ncbi:MAG: hypothetical protein ABII88_03855 [Candidatus Omnitrophota bacterium]